MSNIFGKNKIIDENTNEHDIFTEYFFKGTKYYITKDKKIFEKIENRFKEVSLETTKKILDTMINYQNQDIIDFYDSGER